MGQTPSSIQVNDSGHTLSTPTLQTLGRGTMPTGLSVAAGKTLSLAGGNISLTGGVLTSLDGQVELGAVASPSLVTLNPNDLG